MPTVAAWVDDIRAAFGPEVIDQAWKRRDEGAFWAQENGVELGTRSDLHTRPFVTADQWLATSRDLKALNERINKR